MASRSTQELWDLLEEGSVEEVAARLGELPNPAAADLTLRALANYDLGLDAAAEADFRAALQLEPENPIARSHLALALTRQGRHEEAGRMLLAMPPFPHHGFLRRFLTHFWPLRLEANAAKFAAEEAVAEQPAPVELRWGVPSVGEQLKQLTGRLSPGEAGDQVRRRARAAKLAKKGIKEFFAARREAALAHFEQAHELDPSDVQTAEHLAYLLLLEGEPARAERLLTPVMEAIYARAENGRMDEQHLPPPDLLTCYAWCRHEGGHHAEAIRILTRVAPEGPEDFGAHFVCAMCWLMLGHEREFREALEQALGPYFIDTWEQIVKPMVLRTARTLSGGGA